MVKFCTMLKTLFKQLLSISGKGLTISHIHQFCSRWLWLHNGKDLEISLYEHVIIEYSVNPFPHIDAFWRLCSRRLFKNIVTKEEIAQNKQFLLLPQCLPLLVIGYPFNYRDLPFFDKICSKSSAAELSYEGKG